MQLLHNKRLQRRVQYCSAMVALVQSLHNKRLQRRVQYCSTERAASKEEEHWAFSDEEGALSIHRRGGALSAQLARRRSTGRSAVKEDCSTALSEAETVLKEEEEEEKEEEEEEEEALRPLEHTIPQLRK